MKYVLFGCNHNAGSSQMAQAFFERSNNGGGAGHCRAFRITMSVGRLAFARVLRSPLRGGG